MQVSKILVSLFPDMAAFSIAPIATFLQPRLSTTLSFSCCHYCHDERRKDYGVRRSRGIPLRSLSNSLTVWDSSDSLLSHQYPPSQFSSPAPPQPPVSR